MHLRDQLQELREMGLGTALFRARWELGARLPSRRSRFAGVPVDKGLGWTSRLPFADAVAVADAMQDRVPKAAREHLLRVAEDATHGRILCFGRWVADYGDPIRWQRDEAKDIKLTWEAARFPHAYHVARAAAFHPGEADPLARRLLAQILGFVEANEPGVGVHWSSGQEIAVRLLGWVFALDALLVRSEAAPAAAAVIAKGLAVGAQHIERHFDFARVAVNNNHLISEALGLYVAGVLLPPSEATLRWRAVGKRTLEREAERQFYRDGVYLNLSHNYHRNVVQMLLWASMIARAAGERPSGAWLRALDRSIDLLVAHQNPGDGRLPNYGPNDGSHPSPLSTCDFSDFRPTLQAAALLVRGARLYDAGPWDEEAAWWLGPAVLDAPLRPPANVSRAFEPTGFYVLRGKDARSFVAFRCGTLTDRHGQIDMLHADVWWRGLNVMVDGGSYLYGGPPAWHAHFHGTAGHNTLTIDGRDQMRHVRQFRHLYWTRAKRLAFEDRPGHAVVAGEHYGYLRHRGRCVHRRAVLLRDELVVVVDRVVGKGERLLRLHWLSGPFSWRQENGLAKVSLETPQGTYALAVFDENATAQRASVVAGQEDPPRGWQSRYYGEKVAVPSVAVEARVRVPWTWVTVMGPGEVGLRREGERLTARCAGTEVTFRVNEGLFVLDEGRDG